MKSTAKSREALIIAMSEGLSPKWCFFWGHTPAKNGSVTKSCFSQWWEARPFDRIWGIGMAATDPRAEKPAEWNGLNLLGFALMDVREQLRKGI